jgi:hypothetical protein
MTSVEARVQAGMAFLDTALGPDWVRRINVSRLDINANCYCVLGQLYGDYYEGRIRLGIDFTMSEDLGFYESFAMNWRHQQLTPAWRAAVWARLRQPESVQEPEQAPEPVPEPEPELALA